MSAYVTDCTQDHILPVAINMRESDVREIWCSSKSRPLVALKVSVSISDKPKTIMVDDRPAAIFGICNISVLSGRGVPWLLGTPELEKISYRFVKGSRIVLKEMAQKYKILENYVDARNTASIQWLRWLGFDIMEAESYGPFQVPFHRFFMEVK